LRDLAAFCFFFLLFDFSRGPTPSPDFGPFLMLPVACGKKSRQASYGRGLMLAVRFVVAHAKGLILAVFILDHTAVERGWQSVILWF